MKNKEEIFKKGTQGQMIKKDLPSSKVFSLPPSMETALTPSLLLPPQGLELVLGVRKRDQMRGLAPSPVPTSNLKRDYSSFDGEATLTPLGVRERERGLEVTRKVPHLGEGGFTCKELTLTKKGVSVTGDPSFLPKRREIKSDILPTQNLTSLRGEKPPVTENHYKTLFCFDFAIAFPLSTPMSLPSLEKILLHNTSKSVLTRKGRVLPAWAALSSLTGQRGKLLFSKKSVAAFKVRRGNLLGCKVDLRGERLYQFLDKLIYETLPREMGTGVNSPRALTPSFDSKGLGRTLYTESVNGKRRVPSKGGRGSTVGLKERFSFLDLEGGYQLFEPIKGFDLSLVPSIPLYQLKPIVTPYPLTPKGVASITSIEVQEAITLSPSSPPKIEGRITFPPLKEENRGGMVDAAPCGGWSFLCGFKEEKSGTNPVLALTPKGVRASKGYGTLSFLDKKKRGFTLPPKRQKKGLKGLEVYTSRPKEEVARENPSHPLQYWILLNSFQFPSL
jgi:ribosomal protein L5